MANKLSIENDRWIDVNSVEGHTLASWGEWGIPLLVVEAKLIEMEARITELEAAANATMDLIESSTGVVGLHDNGKTANWSELLQGGQFEEWLLPLSEALKEQE